MKTGISFIVSLSICSMVLAQSKPSPIIKPEQFGSDWIFKRDYGIIGCAEGTIGIEAGNGWSIYLNGEYAKTPDNLKKIDRVVKKQFKGKDVSRQLKVFEEYGQQFCD